MLGFPVVIFKGIRSEIIHVFEIHVRDNNLFISYIFISVSIIGFLKRKYICLAKMSYW